MISRFSFIGMICAVGLAASCPTGFCAGTNNQPAAPAALSISGTSAAPDNSKLDPTRKLHPNDVISVTVYQEDDLATKAIIDQSGMVMLPLLGQVHVGGLTIGEATSQIQHLYDKDYLVNPQVNVTVDDFAKRHFAVLGQVQHPGSFDFPQNESMNLLEAISVAGGYTRLGDPSDVSVRRDEGGASKIYQKDAAKMAKDKQAVFEILPGDVINVGERTF